MKVLKFSGCALSSAASLARVKTIVEGLDQPAILVTAALDGVTDQLIDAAQKAAAGEESYLAILSDIRSRHYKIIEECITEASAKQKLTADINVMLDKLEQICQGIFILQVLPSKSLDEIESFGESIASLILNAYLPGTKLYNALEFIKTKSQGDKNTVATDITCRLIRDRFQNGMDGTAIVSGFISSDMFTDQVTNLGRGGADYTASLIAAALNAEILEIWTGTDGFMTADPRAVRTAYVIEEITYREAMELCNFGVKVIYSPSLYPVHANGIPIHIRNIYRPEAPGTVIRKSCKKDERVIRGISSIDDISLLTLSGTSLVGVLGVDSRVFATLVKERISAFFVSQSTSETGISIGVPKSAARRAKMALDEEFDSEIKSGAILPLLVRNELAAVAVIGENMKNAPGTAGKLFSILGQNGINTISCTQDASESNISLIVERRHLQKALNVIHDSFFLSEYQELNLFLSGVGTVGGQLIEQIAHQKEKLMNERNLKINVVGIARSVKGVFDSEGIDLAHWKESLENGISLTPEKLKKEVIGMNMFNSVFVDCTASADVAALYEDFFNHGISVVAANKIAASSEYSNYRRLKDAARKRNVKYLFETNVGAGLPIIGTINDLCNSGDRILKIEAVLSGTLNFIFNTLSSEIPFSQAVRMAKESGFSEPDPRIDLSGKDVIRKLVILSREAGYRVNQEDVKANLFIPADFFECSLEEFWEKLPSLDAQFEQERQKLEAEHKRWRFVAKMENGEYSVSLRPIEMGHSFYVLDGSNNIILLTTERYNKHPMLIQGYGAGASVTAAGVFADIMSIANIR